MSKRRTMVRANPTIYGPNAPWIDAYTPDQQAIIHAFGLSKADAFQNTSRNPIAAWYKHEAEYMTLATLAITTLLDAGGKGNDTDVQSITTARPTYNATGLNSKGVGVYDGGDYLVLPTALLSLPSGSYNVISVNKRETDHASNDGVWAFTQSATLRALAFYGSTVGQYNFRSKAAGSSNVVITGADSDAFNVFTHRRDGVTTGVAINDDTEITDSLATDVTGITSGTLGTASTFFLTGEIAEIMFLDVNATPTQLQAVRDYFYAKYAIIP